MKIAVFSDIHDNLTRWEEAAKLIKENNLATGICCGDVTSIETLEKIADCFEVLYLALGNADFKISIAKGLIPENVLWFEKIGAFELAGKKVAIIHNDRSANAIAEEGKYDIVFYGHTHTPWEKKVGSSIILNPGEIAGHFGKPSFCIYDLAKMSGKLQILK